MWVGVCVCARENVFETKKEGGDEDRTGEKWREGAVTREG